VVGIAGGHGRAAPCGLADSEAPDELAVELLEALLLLDDVLDPPGDADRPDAVGRSVVGTLRGSQPEAVEQTDCEEPAMPDEPVSGESNAAGSDAGLT